MLEDETYLHPNSQFISHEVNKVLQPCLYFHDQEHEKYFKQEKEIDIPLVYSSSWSMIEENHITNHFENY